jgi:hypothetical protein
VSVSKASGRAYEWLKDRLTLERRTEIKTRLALALGRDVGTPPDSPGRPAIDRTMWDLQSTRYPLPVGRFRATFAPPDRVPFADGLAASLAWLRFLGVDRREELAWSR